MRIALPRERRRGVAGLIVALVIFALIFTAGFGYVIFQDEANLNSYKANAGYQGAQVAAGLEKLAFCAMPTSASSCSAVSSGGPLKIVMNDSGGLPVSVVSWYITDTTGKLISAPGVVQVTPPLTLDVGWSSSIPLSGYSYPACSPPNCPTVFVSVVTSRGNTFSTQFPISTSTVVSSTTSTSVVTSTAPGVGGGNTMVVVMAATPVQVYSGTCPVATECITDNVTVYNYSNAPVTSVTLNPSIPTNTTTGTAHADSTGPCAGPFPSSTIPAYGGSGPAPNIYFQCTYNPKTGSVGGLASFSGGAQGMQGTTNIVSSLVTSNLVQIGSLTNVLTEGVFSSNFFFFKYTSCTKISSGSCTTTNPSSIPPSSIYKLPEGNVISSGSNYYVAFYVQLTNNFNTSLPILSTTFEQLDQSNGGESDWWIVGTNTSSFITNGAYYPSYSGTPSLTKYPSDCASVNPNNKPTDPTCIYLNPGQSVVITLAACGPASSSWDWGSSTTNGSGCVSSSPAFGSGGSATAANTVVCFEYKGQTFTEDLAFQGVAVTS